MLSLWPWLSPCFAYRGQGRKPYRKENQRSHPFFYSSHVDQIRFVLLGNSFKTKENKDEMSHGERRTKEKRSSQRSFWSARDNPFLTYNSTPLCHLASFLLVMASRPQWSCRIPTSVHPTPPLVCVRLLSSPLIGWIIIGCWSVGTAALQLSSSIRRLPWEMNPTVAGEKRF